MPVSSEAWTIERIRDALGSPDLAQRFLSEINRAPAHEVMTAFAKWRGIAERLLAAADRAREDAARKGRGEELRGEWIDGTERVEREVARIRARGAA
jgi:hypothetical protein